MLWGRGHDSDVRIRSSRTSRVSPRVPATLGIDTKPRPRIRGAGLGKVNTKGSHSLRPPTPGRLINPSINPVFTECLRE